MLPHHLAAFLRRFSAASLTFLLLSASVVKGQVEAPVVGQSTALGFVRTIQGVVIDDHKQPIPQAVVLLKDTKTLQVRSYIAQKDGHYHFYGLSMDINYELRAEANNMTSKVKTVSVFTSSRLVKLDLKVNRKFKKK